MEQGGEQGNPNARAGRGRNWQTAYDMPPAEIDTELTLVGRGTAGGEYLRRYWHPVAVAAEIGDLPVKVRALGEDLVLFRTPGGRFGLVHPHCAHRGSSLFYGRVEERGIRCCYHGWLFDPEGHCLEMPCEPEGGGAHRARVRQPWYPVEERYGLVFAYMGPLAQKPGLPRYDILEEVPAGRKLVANGESIGSGGPVIIPCNWLQTHENVMDGHHVPVLHASFSGPQFGEAMAVVPEVSWERTDHGMTETKLRHLPDGRTLVRVLEVVLPTVRIVADPTLTRMGRGDNVAWTLPIDDTHTMIFTVFVFPEGVVMPRNGTRKMYGGKGWHELDEEGHQRFPGDYEAQVSQGAIAAHSRENLMSSDQGVAMFRSMLRRQIRLVGKGEDPVLAGPRAQPWIEVRSSNEMRDA